MTERLSNREILDDLGFVLQLLQERLHLGLPDG